jgi:Flp pilus assembly protein TadG
MVELAAVILPVLLILVGIIQFGLLFGAHVAITNAAREAARTATIYSYNNGEAKSWNDGRRCRAALDAATAAFGLLSPSAPHFAATTTGDSCTTTTGETQVNGDLTISYCSDVVDPDDPCPDVLDPTTTCTVDTRADCLVRVTLTYHSDIVVPLLGAILETDANGRFVHGATATMVVN